MPAESNGALRHPSQFRPSPDAPFEGRPAPNSRRGGAALRAEALRARVTNAFEPLGLTEITPRGAAPKRVAPRSSLGQLTSVHPSRFPEATASSSLGTPPPPGRGESRLRSYPVAFLTRLGRDATRCSTAVIQFSMSTRANADSHSSTRHPVTSRPRSPSFRTRLLGVAPAQTHLARGGSAASVARTAMPFHGHAGYG